MSDWPLAVGFGIAAGLTTIAGGMLALRLAERTAALLAVAAGIVLGVAFFDLLPEALEHAAGRYSGRTIIACAAGGLVAYFVIARTLSRAKRHAAWHAHLAPASLTLHSLLDGVVMGLAFQLAPNVGWMVALAVLMHDLADGVNIVGLALEATRRRAALVWLAVNGAAPLAGVLIGLSVAMPPATLAPVMAVFAGIFLYIGAIELVPRSLARDPRPRTGAQVLGGMAAMLAVTLLAG